MPGVGPFPADWFRVGFPLYSPQWSSVFTKLCCIKAQACGSSRSSSYREVTSVGIHGDWGGGSPNWPLPTPESGLRLIWAAPPKSGCTEATFAPVRIDATLGILKKATYQLQVVSMYEGWGMVIPATSWFNKYLPSSMDLTWTKPSSSNPIRPKFAATVSV